MVKVSVGEQDISGIPVQAVKPHDDDVSIGAWVNDYAGTEWRVWHWFQRVQVAVGGKTSHHKRFRRFILHSGLFPLQWGLIPAPCDVKLEGGGFVPFAYYTISRRNLQHPVAPAYSVTEFFYKKF